MPNEEPLTAPETDEWRHVFREALRALRPEDLRPSSPCPDSGTMVSYVMGTASEAVRKEINGHVVFCDDCWDDYVALAGREKIAELVRAASAEERVSFPVAIKDAKAYWGQLVAQAHEFLIDLGKNYGPGALIGAVKVVAEGPAPAVRGEFPSSTSSKVIEVAVSDNVYGIEILEEGSNFVFDVAGYKMTRPVPMRLAVQLESGDEVAWAETDKQGYASLILSKEKLPEGEFVLTFALEDELWEMLFVKLPEKPSV